MSRADAETPLLADSVFERLKREIVELTLAPNDLIVENSLATQYGVSKGPVREALKRLSALGWVRALPRVGYLITPVRVNDVDEIFAMRVLLEPEATRLATNLATDDDLVELEMLAGSEADAHAAPAHDRGILVARANSLFHSAIARLSGNSRLERMITSLIDELERVIHLLAQDPSSLLDEHPTLVAVMRTRDSEAAASCMRKQLELTHAAMRAAAIESAQLGFVGKNNALN